jgi:exopolysaccharide biosynthesis polyprenyl glycosylphosphotransferase
MAVAVGVGLAMSGQLAHPETLDQFFAARIKITNFAFVLGFAVIWVVLFKIFGLYRSRRIGTVSAEWWDIFKAVSVGTLLLSGLAPVLDLTAVNRIFVVSFFSTAVVGTILVRSVLRMALGGVRRNGRNMRNLVIVGCGPRGAEIGKEVRANGHLGYLLLGYIDEIAPPRNPLHGHPEKLLGDLDQAREILGELEVDEVVISLPIKSYYEKISELITMCEELGLVVRIPADFFESRIVNAYLDDFHDTPVLTLKTHAPASGSALVKRSIYIIGSSLALIVFSPLMLIIMIAILIDNWGPVFFVQERVGLRRRRFPMVKFRTMHTDAEARLDEIEELNEVNGAAFKMKDDPRITRVGRFLRKLSLDEFPQFFNVFRGDMSLVGPRPLPVRDVQRFGSEWQKRRFSVRPGLTCLWQINGRHEIDFEHWMELDLQYIDNWSLSLDIDILVKTLPAVLRGTGAS